MGEFHGYGLCKGRSRESRVNPESLGCKKER